MVNVDYIYPRTKGKVAPDILVPANAGMLIYADGVNYNPGAGEGWYEWTGTALVKLKRTNDTIGQQPIFDMTVVASGGDGVHTINGPVSSITTNGIVTLDGNAHGGYRAEIIVRNTDSVTHDYRQFANNDQVDANYTQWGIHFGNASANEIPVVDARFIIGAPATTWFHADVRIFQDANGQLSTIFNILYNQPTVADYGFLRNWFKTATVTNLTRLDWTGYFGVGSRVRLWRNI